MCCPDGYSLYGGAGDDILEVWRGQLIDGGAGSDTASFAGSTVGRQYTLGDSDLGRWQLKSIENIECGEGNDTVIDTDEANILKGGGGNDNFINYGGGDTIDGGAGIDRVSYYGTAVTVDLLNGVGSGGYAEGDTYVSIEIVTAYDGNDLLIGSNGDDRLYGNSGSDTLRGGAGADRLDGGEYNDTVSYYTSAAGVTVNLADRHWHGGRCSGRHADQPRERQRQPVQRRPHRQRRRLERCGAGAATTSSAAERIDPGWRRRQGHGHLLGQQLVRL